MTGLSFHPKAATRHWPVFYKVPTKSGLNGRWQKRAGKPFTDSSMHISCPLPTKRAAQAGLSLSFWKKRTHSLNVRKKNDHTGKTNLPGCTKRHATLTRANRADVAIMIETLQAPEHGQRPGDCTDTTMQGVCGWHSMPTRSTSVFCGLRRSSVLPPRSTPPSCGLMNWCWRYHAIICWHKTRPLSICEHWPMPISFFFPRHWDAGCSNTSQH